MAKSVTNGKPTGKPFQKGVSPNPGGAPKGETSPRRIEINARLLARELGVGGLRRSRPDDWQWRAPIPGAEIHRGSGEAIFE
jgi:hypothetical protein